MPICKYCGKNFTRTNRLGQPPKYCSKGCYKKAHYQFRVQSRRKILIEENSSKNRKCLYCGKPLPLTLKRGTKYCSGRCFYKKFTQDHPDYSRQEEKKIRINRIQSLGGKCGVCGETDFRTLEGHHKNHDKQKDGEFYSRRFFEIDWILLCANCHKILHWEEREKKWIEMQKAKSSGGN